MSHNKYIPFFNALLRAIQEERDDKDSVTPIFESFGHEYNGHVLHRLRFLVHYKIIEAKLVKDADRKPTELHVSVTRRHSK